MENEKRIENSILMYLQYQPGILAFKINTIGVYDQRKGIYRKPSRFVIPGTPDIIACLSIKEIGIFVSFEVKSAKGRQSKEQKCFQESLTMRADGFYFLVRSIQDVEKSLEYVKKTVLEKMDPSPHQKMKDPSSVISRV